MSTNRVLGLALFLFVVLNILLLIAGCGGGARGTRVHMGVVGGNFWWRDVASGSMQPTGGRTDLDVSVPVEGLPVGGSMGSNSLVGISSLQIDSVSGDVIMESALTGTIGVDIPEALSRIYVPSIDPFSDVWIEHGPPEGQPSP